MEKSQGRQPPCGRGPRQQGAQTPAVGEWIPAPVHTCCSGPAAFSTRGDGVLLQGRPSQCSPQSVGPEASRQCWLKMAGPGPGLGQNIQVGRPYCRPKKPLLSLPRCAGLTGQVGTLQKLPLRPQEKPQPPPTPDASSHPRWHETGTQSWCPVPCLQSPLLSAPCTHSPAHIYTCTLTHPRTHTPDLTLVHTHLHSHLHTLLHTPCTHTSAFTLLTSHLHTHLHTHVYTHTLTHAHPCTHPLHSHTPAYTPLHTHPCTHTPALTLLTSHLHRHICTHTCTHIYTHTNTCTHPEFTPMHSHS
ncbi:uncharacterized protein SPEM3-like [Macaca nemestrina]|uniref:uncharacterized protein SPEM3-like n=1 Tax=Macaca nemestrina TaxID=9545 RepID=UPI0039B99670